MPPTEKPEFHRFGRYYQRLGPILERSKNSETVAAIFSLLVVSLFGWYAIRPTVQTILFLRREIADKTIVNQKMEEKITSLIEAQAAYESASTQLPLVSEALPPVPEAIDLAAQIAAMAATTGASVSAIQVQSVPVAEGATPSAVVRAASEQGAFTLTVVVDGPWTSIDAFLRGLVSLRRITTIDSLALKPNSAFALGGATLNLVLKISSYYGG